ncbi:DUF932 domain-containing protein [Gimesia sp.]|uniref:DUF932 domain-containing protein n=1 Tax=Gimesia sp. TaxID=2024833 RepID=UPI003A905EA7
MPANISFQNSKAEAFTSLRPAWWDRKGEYVADQHLTSKQVWGKRGVLNYEYELRSISDAKTGMKLDGYRHCIRKDTGVTVGCGMTDGYRIVQPRQAFDFLDDLMRDGGMRYASAGVLGKGEEIWILGVIPNDDQPIYGETHNRYVLWTDRFDGGGTLKCFPCVTRVECANTLAVALSEWNAKLFKGIRHSGDMQAKLDAARQTLVEVESAFQKYNADCQKLISARFNRDDARHFIETLLPVLDDDASQHSKSIRERKVQAVREAMRDETNNLGEMKGTWYQLANAVTFAIDHGNVLHFRGDQRTNRFRSLMMNDGANLKRKAFDLALNMAS